MLILSANIATDINNLTNNFNWTSPSWDMFIFVLFIVLFLLYCLALRKKKVVILTLSLYMALLISQSIPMMNLEMNILRLVVFWVLFIFVFFFLYKSKVIRVAKGTLRWWQAILFNFFHVGLLISINVRLLSVDKMGQDIPLSANFFAGEWSGLVWALAPILLLPFIRAKKEEDE